jgi:pyrroloquinoline-quinone synthase
VAPGASEGWDRDTFAAHLRAVGQRYHDRHPFHVRMNAGLLTPEQVRAWVANRYHYQNSIPLKDAAIVSNCPLREVRRLWVQRIVYHDGGREGEGGIEAWLRLADAVGLRREEVLDERHVLPGVRFAVDAYVQFARTRPWPVAVASSLTEMFAGDAIRERLAAFDRHYPWVPAWGFEYFRSRVTQSRLEADHALELTLTHCNTRDLQGQAVAALHFKCDVLWAILDALHLACAPAPSEKG